MLALFYTTRYTVCHPVTMVRIEGVRFMKTEYTAVIKQEGDWQIGWIEEIPGINCQEATREELTETLRITLREAIELNRVIESRSVQPEQPGLPGEGKVSGFSVYERPALMK